MSLAGTRVTRERPEATGQEGFPLPTQREGLGVQRLCRLPREGPARPQAPPPTAPARERQVREGPHGERPHHTTVHRPEGGTGRPCLSNEAESLTALLGTATPCQGPGHRPGAMERAEQGPPPAPRKSALSLRKWEARSASTAPGAGRARGREAAPPAGDAATCVCWWGHRPRKRPCRGVRA